MQKDEDPDVVNEEEDSLIHQKAENVSPEDESELPNMTSSLQSLQDDEKNYDDFEKEEKNMMMESMGLESKAEKE